MKPISTEQAMRYSRQILLSGFDLDKQEILINSRVLVIGIGGLGCAVCQYLVASGIGHLTLVDDDVVETTNLQRQVLHDESSIGQRKVDSAANALKRLNASVSLTLLHQRQSEAELNELIMQHDIVVDCTDNLETRNGLNKACYENEVSLVSGAAIRMEGQVFCVLPKQQSACYGCISAFFGEQQLSCVESGVMSPVVGIIGSVQALETIKILTGYGEGQANKLQIFDAFTSEWRSLNVKPNPSCSVCSKVKEAD